MRIIINVDLGSFSNDIISKIYTFQNACRHQNFRKGFLSQCYSVLLYYVTQHPDSNNIIKSCENYSIISTYNFLSHVLMLLVKLCTEKKKKKFKNYPYSLHEKGTFFFRMQIKN